MPLSQIANVSVPADPVDIQHEALSRYVDVTAPVSSGSSDAARSSLRQQAGDACSFPLDYHAEIVGATPETRPRT